MSGKPDSTLMWLVAVDCDGSESEISRCSSLPRFTLPNHCGIATGEACCSRSAVRTPDAIYRYNLAKIHCSDSK